MRLVVLLILIVGAVVGVSLIRAGGGSGTGMILFAILAVIFFASLPVLTGKFAAKPIERADAGHGRQVVDLNPTNGDAGR